MKLLLTRKIVGLQGRRFFSNFATAKRSYYEILQIEPNFTPRILRKKYLMKAKKYHPDVNKQPGALQEFKLVKEAYQTLKDVQRRHMYDSGVSEIPDDVSPVHNHEAKGGRKYYENKWYGYQSPNHKDQRDQYYKAKAEFFSEEPLNPWRYIIPFSFIVVGLFGYDFYMTLESKKQKEKRESMKVIQNSIADESKMSKRQKLLQRYVQKREKEHKVDL